MLSCCTCIFHMYHLYFVLRSGDVKFTVRSTLKNEGLRGIYRGGAVHVFGQMPSSFVYIVTYEWVKHQLKSKYPEYRRLCEASAAFSAVVLSQTISNPVDIVTQSLILIKKGGKPSNKSIKLDFPEEIRSQSGFRLIGSICMSIKQQRGLRGFWKGYPASVSTFAFGSVLWWPLYSKFSGKVSIFSEPMNVRGDNVIALLSASALAAWTKT